MRRRILEIWGRLPIPTKLRHWIVGLTVSKFPVGVSAAILDDEGRVLMFKHTYRGRYPWGLPSGWLEVGEQPHAAVAREIMEETGLEVDRVRPIFVYSAAERRHIDLAFSARLVGGSFRPSAEVTEMAWFDRDALPEMLPDQYDMILQILAALEA